jgi:hypothetical protein
MTTTSRTADAAVDAPGPEFVFVPHDASPDRPAGMPSDRERIALHRGWLAALDAGTMPAAKVALLDRWAAGWRSDDARAFLASVPTARRG